MALVTAEDLENIPVRGFNSIMALQNSVVVQDNNIYIRGGRNEEVGYYVDGASSSNPLSNAQTIHIIQEAVEEFQVLAGGYTAEFGGANSGIIRSEYKTGSRDWHVSLNFQTDKFADAKQGGKFLGTHSYGHHIGVGTISGPLGTDNIRLFAAVENTDQDDRLRRFSEGFEFERIDVNRSNPDVINGHPDTVSFAYPDGFTPNNGFERWAGNGTLLFDYSPISFRVSGSYSNSKTFQDRSANVNFLNQRQGYWDNTSLLMSGKLTHVLNPKTFYNLTLSYFDRKNETQDNWFGGEWQDWFNGTKIAQNQNEGDAPYRTVLASDQTAWLPPYPYSFNGIEFSRNGAPPAYAFGTPSETGASTRYDLDEQSYLGGALDFVSQLGRHHELKVGANTRQYTARRFSVLPREMKLTEQYTSGNASSVNPGIWAKQAAYRGYGYDLFGNSVDDAFSYGDSIFVDAPKKPSFTAVYVQDKIEFNDIIINAGLRWDLINTDDRRLTNRVDPEFDRRSGQIKQDQFEDVPTFSQISPRLGVSFPVSEKTVFYGQYGKFVQSTELNDIYVGTQFIGDRLTAGTANLGTPFGLGIEPIKTTSYELGFRQQLGDHAAFDITGFYRNDKGQIKIERVSGPATSGISSYNILTNGDFVTTRGLEFKFSLRRVNRLQAQFNYTLTKAEGTGSGENNFAGAIENQTAVPTTINPLDFNQQHKGSIILDYRWGQNDGGPLLSRLGANVIFSFNSGHPFTTGFFNPGGQISPYNAGVDYMQDPRFREALEQINSSTTPWNFLTDLRLDKSISIAGSLDLTLFARVTNLFNTKNVVNVYSATGNADDDGYLSRPAYSQGNIDRAESFGQLNGYEGGGEEYVDLFRAVNLVNGSAYYSNLNLELWDNPRQIFFGLKLAY